MKLTVLFAGFAVSSSTSSSKVRVRDPTREHFASQMFSRVFSMPYSAEAKHSAAALYSNNVSIVNMALSANRRLCARYESTQSVRHKSRPFYGSGTDQDNETEAKQCSDSYFNGIGRPAMPLYFDHVSGNLIGDIDPVDGKLNRREWETIHHRLSYAISVAMISLIKEKSLAEITPADLTLVDDEKTFLEEQLKYYFEFSDNRWDLNVAESELEDKVEWNHVEVAILINRLYNDFIRKHGA